MDITLSLPELLALALRGQPLPAGLSNPRLEGALGHVDVDLREVPGAPTAVRLAGRASGPLHVTVALASFAGGAGRFCVQAQARNLPAHRLAAVLRSPINSALNGRLAAHGIAQSAVHVSDEDGQLIVTVRLPDIVTSVNLPPFLTGIEVTELAIADGRIHLSTRHPTA